MYSVAMAVHLNSSLRCLPEPGVHCLLNSCVDVGCWRFDRNRSESSRYGRAFAWRSFRQLNANIMLAQKQPAAATGRPRIIAGGDDARRFATALESFLLGPKASRCPANRLDLRACRDICRKARHDNDVPPWFRASARFNPGVEHGRSRSVDDTAPTHAV